MSARRRLLAGVTLVACVACHETGVVPQHRVAGGDAVRGELAIVGYGCGSCHAIPGVPAAEGRVGPSLAQFAERRTIAGRLPNGPENLVRWIRAPQRIDPATLMPDLGVTEGDAHDIAAYLYGLPVSRLGPPRLFSR